MRKSDRTVIDLTEKKQGVTRLANKIFIKGNGEQAKMIDFEDLDAEILQNYLHRLLAFLI